MELSVDTENVLNYLEAFSEHVLRKRHDMGVLCELAARREAHEEMNPLIFRGTPLFKLFHTLRKAPPGSEGYQTLEKEFSSAIETIRDLLATLLIEADEEHIHRFETHYYAMTQGSLRNIVDLAHDLNIAKAVQNDNKYGSPATEDNGE